MHVSLRHTRVSGHTRVSVSSVSFCFCVRVHLFVQLPHKSCRWTREDQGGRTTTACVLCPYRYQSTLPNNSIASASRADLAVLRFFWLDDYRVQTWTIIGMGSIISTILVSYACFVHQVAIIVFGNQCSMLCSGRVAKSFYRLSATLSRHRLAASSVDFSVVH